MRARRAGSFQAFQKRSLGGPTPIRAPKLTMKKPKSGMGPSAPNFRAQAVGPMMPQAARPPRVATQGAQAGYGMGQRGQLSAEDKERQRQKKRQKKMTSMGTKQFKARRSGRFGRGSKR